MLREPADSAAGRALELIGALRDQRVCESVCDARRLVTVRRVARDRQDVALLLRRDAHVREQLISSGAQMQPRAHTVCNLRARDDPRGRDDRSAHVALPEKREADEAIGRNGSDENVGAGLVSLVGRGDEHHGGSDGEHDGAGDVRPMLA